MTCHVVGQGQLKLPSAREGEAIQVGDDLYGERSAGKATLAAGRAEVVVGDCVSEGGHGPEDSAEIPAGSTPAEARCDKSIRGERDQIRSPTAGKRFSNYSLSSQACRPRHSLSISSRCIQGDSVTDRYGRCDAGSATGGQRKGRREKCSLRKSIDRASCASRTLHTAGNWG